MAICPETNNVGKHPHIPAFCLLTVELAVARFRAFKMIETTSPHRVRRFFEVEAASQEEAVEIVLRNMRESLEAEGFRIKTISCERVEQQA